MKKRGFGKGHYNGFGGKVEPGESVEAGAVRELEEEAGISCPDLTRCGLLEFMFEGDPCLMEVHVYCGSAVEGTPTESDEMAPAWWPLDGIPLQSMWPDDKLWFPTMLHLTAAAAGSSAEAGPTVAPGSGAFFSGRFVFRGLDTIVASDLHRVQELPEQPPVTAIPMPWDGTAAAAWLQEVSQLQSS